MNVNIFTSNRFTCVGNGTELLGTLWKVVWCESSMFSQLKKKRGRDHSMRRGHLLECKTLTFYTKYRRNLWLTVLKRDKLLAPLKLLPFVTRGSHIAVRFPPPIIQLLLPFYDVKIPASSSLHDFQLPVRWLLNLGGKTCSLQFCAPPQQVIFLCNILIQKQLLLSCN